MHRLKALIENGEYEIRIQNGLIGRIGEELSDLIASRRLHVVTDVTIQELWGGKMIPSLRETGATITTSLLCPGEDQKNLETVSRLYDAFIQAGITRSDYVLALGGGVIGDITGFAAATYLRGVPFIQVPTTLLSQVDSSVGGKVGVNLPQGKNLVGSFYQPARVLIDPTMLTTLSDRLFAEGMAEVLKYGAIADEAFFKHVAGRSRTQLMDDMESTIRRCCSIKAEIVMRDPMDKGERMMLNFGHTLGHALEEAAGYGSYFHGEAVAIGMMAALRYGEEMGATLPGSAELMENALKTLDLPIAPDKTYDLTHAVMKDKKRMGEHTHFILLRRIGEAFIHRMTQKELVDLAGRIRS